jgi:hypothetical protein
LTPSGRSSETPWAKALYRQAESEGNMFRFRGGRALLALAVGAGVFGIATAVQASIPDAQGVIHGCYSTSLAHGSPTGALRVIDTAKLNGNCASWETALNWNQTGPRGPTGARGPTGPKGATGAKGPTGAKGATGPSEAVSATASVGTPPSSPTAQGGITAASTFTTTVAGKLQLSKPIDAYLACANNVGVWWWITLDGAVVPSSFTHTQAGTSFISQTLVGVTASSVAAGTHTMDINTMCDTGAWSQAGWFNFSGGTAIVVG